MRLTKGRLTVSSMRFSNYSLDKFVAHKLSTVTTCGALDLGGEKKSFLNAFILNTMFRVTIEAKQKAFLFNYLRRVEGALRTYRSAREALTLYVSTPRNVVSPYFEALDFEVCIAQTYQALEMIATSIGEDVFDKGDNSNYEKIHTLYIDSKHMDRMIDGGRIPDEATTGIWLTNEGLESKRGKVHFTELV